MPKRRAHQPARETDARDAELRKFWKGRVRRATHNIDGAVDRFDQVGDGVAVENPDWIGTIRARLQVGVRALHRVLEAARWLTVCQQKGVYARIDNERNINRSRYFTQRMNQLHLARDIYQRFSRLRERVFDIDANNAGRDHGFDGLEHLVNGAPIPRLDIRRNRTCDDARNSGSRINQHVPADVLAVAVAQRGGDPRARCGDGAESSLLNQTRARGIPYVWQDQQRRFMMKPAKLCRALLLTLRTHRRTSHECLTGRQSFCIHYRVALALRQGPILPDPTVPIWWCEPGRE